MALVNTPDIQHTLIAETVYGQTPTTGTRYILPTSAEQGLLTAEFTEIVSNTKRPGRTSNGSQRGMVNVTGTLDMRFMKTPVIDALLEYALSTSFVSKVAKAGQTDKSFSVISKLANDQFKFYSGLMAKGFTLDVKANDGVTCNFDIMGSGYSVGTTDNAVTLTDIAGSTVEYVGSDVKNISIGGASVWFSELSFQTTLDRTQRPVLGSNVGLAFGVNSPRVTTFTARVYRESLALDTMMLANNRFSMSLDAGQYRFACPAMDFTVPTDELNSGSAFLNIKGTAAYDATQGTDLIVTQL